MMPLLNKFLSTRKINKKSQDCKLPIKIEFKGNSESSLIVKRSSSSFHFGADQVRLLLFKECEWRGRKLLFDSVTAERNNTTVHDNTTKHSNGNDSCPRSGNGLPQANEQDSCDNVSLLSEIVFGTVAMTYRGTLFKVHTFDSPRCIMCTKVFPAPDYNSHTKHSSDRFTEDNSVYKESSINKNMRNSLSTASSGNFSVKSLRKSSTCSSTCSGWDLDVPLRASSQSLESNSTSGFSSLSSFRPRWLKAASTSLSYSESDVTVGSQLGGDISGGTCELKNRKHKTRLGLALLIKLTPGVERQMEVRLLEHAAQLEAMLNRLCYACIEPKRNCMNHDRKQLIVRLQQASVKCIRCLLLLLVTMDNTKIPSIWHEIILNSSKSLENQVNILYPSFHDMCHLLQNLDTKSTNFFLSTLVTAVLTYHLGWVNTVMNSYDKTWMESLNKKYPCNPLWVQLGDLHGALGYPTKLVQTIITGNSDKTGLINAILSFLSYLIRSSLVKKQNQVRVSPEKDLQQAIMIVEQYRRKLKSNCTNISQVKTDSTRNSRLQVGSSSRRPSKQQLVEKRERKIDENKGSMNMNITRLRKTSSLLMNLDSHDKLESEYESPIKLQSSHENFTDYETCESNPDKDTTAASVKIIVSEISSENFVSEKNLPRTSALDELEGKNEWRDTDQSMLSASKLPFLHDPSDSATMKINVPDDTQVYFSRVEYPDDKRDQVTFTLGGEEKTSSIDTPTLNNFNCQCSFAFTRVPSTWAQLPDHVLRKILQRNFPESSKSIQRPENTCFSRERDLRSCPKCTGNYESSNLLLETPTNATEVSRTCGNSVNARGARQRRVDRLEELLEANNFVELPMPRSKSLADVTNNCETFIGFTDTLLQRKVRKPTEYKNTGLIDGYTPGLVVQGLIKSRSKNKSEQSREENDNWIAELREEISVNARFPIVDLPVSEALGIVADLDTWQVGILSNNMLPTSPLIAVGMSKLVSDMLEAFVYLWTKYRSPIHCFHVLECKLKNMLLRSQALAEMLMTTNVCDASLSTLTTALDLDAADVPLLLAVATTHSPQIAQRFGLTFT